MIPVIKAEAAESFTLSLTKLDDIATGISHFQYENMESSIKKKLCGCLVAILLTQPGLSASAQEPEQAQRILQPRRIEGSSFGTRKEEAILPQEKLQQQAPGFMMPGSTQMGLTYQVHVLGEVHKPGTYRVPASSRLSEALDKAGGIQGQGSRRRIALRRGGRERGIDYLSFELYGNLDANPYLLDNDVVRVPLQRNVVLIEGTIKRPGNYELRDEKNLEDLLKLAGGPTPGMGISAPIKVIRISDEGKEVVEVENNKVRREQFLLRDADTVVFPHILTANRKFDYNLASLPGDNELFYPSYDERIFVLGAVAKPGPYPFTPYYDIQQYLTLAGGTTRLAKVKKIQVLVPGGGSQPWTAETQINPGNTIFVPEKYMSAESVLALVLALTTTVLGITTTILTINNN